MKCLRRSPIRERQKIWFSTVKEVALGIDTIEKYSKPIMKKMTVSAGTGMPGQISAGLVVDYDRELINYDHSFVPEEGNVLWVDVEPQLDTSGNLVMAADKITPLTPPDYRITQVFRTQKGSVDVFGIKKIGGVQ